MFFFNHYQKIYIWQTVGGRGGLFKPWWNFCVEFYNVILICAWLDFFFFFFGNSSPYNSDVRHCENLKYSMK